MQKIQIALSAFSARATQGRRSVLLVYSALVTLVLFGLAQLIARQAELDQHHVDALALADMFAMLLVGGALFVIAPAMVAAQVGDERRSGTLDLLRTAPLPPTALAVGFLVGAPASLYLMLAGPLALHVVAGLSGAYPIPVLPQSLFVIGLGSVALMLLSMLAALSVGREGPAGATPMLVAGALGLGAMTAVGMASDPNTAAWAHLHPAGALAGIYCAFDGPYQQTFVSSWRLERFSEGRIASMQLIAPVFSTLIYLAGSAILLIAARRALAGDPPSRLSKGEAIGLFTLATVAIAVPLRIVTSVSELAQGPLAVVAVALAPVFVACVVGATPSALGYGDGRAPRLSPRGAPLLGAVLMLVSGLVVLSLLYGANLIYVVLTAGHCGFYIVGFGFTALTLPIYSLFSSTRLGSTAARLSFWAVISLMMVLQIPSLVTLISSRRVLDVTYLLAKIGVGIGVIVPLVIAWRQRVGDRRRSAVPV